LLWQLASIDFNNVGNAITENELVTKCNNLLTYYLSVILMTSSKRHWNSLNKEGHSWDFFVGRLQEPSRWSVACVYLHIGVTSQLHSEFADQTSWSRSEVCWRRLRTKM